MEFVDDSYREWAILKALSMYLWKIEISNIYWRIDILNNEYFAPINNIDNKTV